MRFENLCLGRRTFLRTATVLGVLLIGVGLSGCDLLQGLYGGGDEGLVETDTVEIRDFSFQPKTIKVATGTTVTWTQGDDVAHTVTSTDPAGLFDSGDLSRGERFAFTFTEPGTYRYFCSIHPSMRGAVIVE